MEGKILHQKKTLQLTLLRYSLYYGGLEPNLQYLQGMSAFEFVKSVSKRHSFLSIAFPVLMILLVQAIVGALVKVF